MAWAGGGGEFVVERRSEVHDVRCDALRERGDGVRNRFDIAESS